MQIPDFSRQSILDALRRQYALSGELRELVGERDQNLRLTTADGQQYVVKISGSDESKQAAELQARALLHLQQRDTHLHLPRVVPALSGESLGSIGGHLLRVVSWVAGEVLNRETMTPAVAASLGSKLAELGQSLQDFDHAGQTQNIAWDMQRALSLRERLAHIREKALQRNVGCVFDEFEQRGLPAFAGLRRQVIHNDANPDNVLVDRNADAVVGIIDFGDLLDAPLIVDVAVAGSYLRDAREPLRLLRPFVSAYNDVTPLNAEELGLLHLLLRVRLATTIAMGHWRAAEFGDDDEYRQKSLATEDDAVRFLHSLNEMDQQAFAAQLVKKT